MTLQELRIFLDDWFCGCGSPEDAARCLRDVLALHPLYDNRPAFEALIPDDGLQYLLLYTLHHFDLTEHGGTVGGGWLTDKGKSVLSALQANDLESVCASACAHGYSVDDEWPEDCEACRTELAQ